MELIKSDRMLEAQVSVLGSLLIEPSISGELISEVRVSDFTTPLYQKIYEACRKIFLSQSMIDPVAVCAEIGTDYSQILLEIMEVTPTATQWRAYASIMREQAMLSRITVLADELSACISIDDASVLIDKLNQQFSGRQDTKIVSFEQGMTDFFNRHNSNTAPNYLRWGLPVLNKMLFAKPGHFIILGGYPSAGKTVLAFQFGWEQARMCGKNVGIFSLETDDEDLYDRLVSFAAHVSYENINNNSLSADEWRQAAELGGISHEVKLDVIDASGMTVSEIRAIALAKHYDVIYIDYVQLIRSEKSSRSTRTETVTEISMDLHTFARTSGITIVALSQLTRPDKASQGTSPKMSSLRESGQLEQDADIIMLLFLEDESAPDGDRRLKIAKNKKGRRGIMTLGFDPLKMAFFQRSTRTDEPMRKSRFKEEPPGDEQEVIEVFRNSKGGTA